MAATAQKWKAVKAAKMTPERKARLDGDVKHERLEMALRELRGASGKTQAEVAEVASMTQAELSRVERRDDHLVSTLRRYVEALDGQLEVVAVVGNKRIVLSGV